MNIGVLALQGAFAEHRLKFEAFGSNVTEIRKKEDFHAGLDGLVLPGGESTTMGKLLQDFNLLTPIKKEIEAGLPVFGTCAGMILLARKLVNDDRVHLGTMDIVVERNGYGRQLGSFQSIGVFGTVAAVPMTFIRGPKLVEIGPKVKKLAQIDGITVAARQENQLVTAFHPELHENDTIYEYFIRMIKGRN